METTAANASVATSNGTVIEVSPNNAPSESILSTSTGVHTTTVATGAHYFVIDFENQLANGWGSGGAVPVYRQYAESMGVILNHPTVIDYRTSARMFTHSGNNSIEVCYAVEFCHQNLEVQIRFTTETRSAMARIFCEACLPLKI